MGWLYTHGSTKQDVRDSILRDLGSKVLAHRTVGSHLWAAVERADGQSFIFLALLGKSDGDWGYKDMDETMHPYVYDCPLALLKMVGDPPTEQAAEWREKVHAYHSERKRRQEMHKRIKVGTVVRLERRRPDIFKIMNLAPLRGEGPDGRIYKIPKAAIVEVLEDDQR